MRTTRSFRAVLVAVAILAGTAPTSAASEAASISIERHGRLTSAGGVIFRVQLTCGPLPGSPEFTEGFVGAHQPKSGADGEGGLSPDIVCDGIERSYTAGVSSISDASFERGPAGASASFFACSVDGDNQVCVSGSTGRRIVISGRELP